MALFSRPAGGRDDGLAAHLGLGAKAARAAELARGTGADGLLVVALRTTLAVREDGAWRTIDWQLVRDGTWDGAGGMLRAELLDGRKLAWCLEDAGHVPEVFAERVQASILVSERIRVPGGEVVLTGRRTPSASRADARPVLWHAMAVGAARLDEPRTSEIVRCATERLRTDYEFPDNVC